MKYVRYFLGIQAAQGENANGGISEGHNENDYDNGYHNGNEDRFLPLSPKDAGIDNDPSDRRRGKPLSGRDINNQLGLMRRWDPFDTSIFLNTANHVVHYTALTVQERRWKKQKRRKEGLMDRFKKSLELKSFAEKKRAYENLEKQKQIEKERYKTKARKNGCTRDLVELFDLPEIASGADVMSSTYFAKKEEQIFRLWAGKDPNYGTESNGNGFVEQESTDQLAAQLAIEMANPLAITRQEDALKMTQEPPYYLNNAGRQYYMDHPGRMLCLAVADSWKLKFAPFTTMTIPDLIRRARVYKRRNSRWMTSIGVHEDSYSIDGTPSHTTVYNPFLLNGPSYKKSNAVDAGKKSSTTAIETTRQQKTNELMTEQERIDQELTELQPIIQNVIVERTEECARYRGNLALVEMGLRIETWDAVKEYFIKMIERELLFEIADSQFNATAPPEGSEGYHSETNFDDSAQTTKYVEEISIPYLNSTNKIAEIGEKLTNEIGDKTNDDMAKNEIDDKFPDDINTTTSLRPLSRLHRSWETNLKYFRVMHRGNYLHFGKFKLQKLMNDIVRYIYESFKKSRQFLICFPVMCSEKTLIENVDLLYLILVQGLMSRFAFSQYVRQTAENRGLLNDHIEHLGRFEDVSDSVSWEMNPERHLKEILNYQDPYPEFPESLHDGEFSSRDFEGVVRERTPETFITLRERQEAWLETKEATEREQKLHDRLLEVSFDPKLIKAYSAMMNVHTEMMQNHETRLMENRNDTNFDTTSANSRKPPFEPDSSKTDNFSADASEYYWFLKYHFLEESTRSPDQGMLNAITPSLRDFVIPPNLMFNARRSIKATLYLTMHQMLEIRNLKLLMSVGTGDSKEGEEKKKEGEHESEQKKDRPESENTNTEKTSPTAVILEENTSPVSAISLSTFLDHRYSKQECFAPDANVLLERHLVEGILDQDEGTNYEGQAPDQSPEILTSSDLHYRHQDYEKTAHSWPEGTNKESMASLKLVRKSSKAGTVSWTPPDAPYWRRQVEYWEGNYRLEFSKESMNKCSGSSDQSSSRSSSSGSTTHSNDRRNKKRVDFSYQAILNLRNSTRWHQSVYPMCESGLPQWGHKCLGKQLPDFFSHIVSDKNMSNVLEERIPVLNGIQTEKGPTKAQRGAQVKRARQRDQTKGKAQQGTIAREFSQEKFSQQKPRLNEIRSRLRGPLRILKEGLSDPSVYKSISKEIEELSKRPSLVPYLNELQEQRLRNKGLLGKSGRQSGRKQWFALGVPFDCSAKTLEGLMGKSRSKKIAANKKLSAGKIDVTFMLERRVRAKVPGARFELLEALKNSWKEYNKYRLAYNTTKRNMINILRGNRGNGNEDDFGYDVNYTPDFEKIVDFVESGGENAVQKDKDGHFRIGNVTYDGPQAITRFPPHWFRYRGPYHIASGGGSKVFWESHKKIFDFLDGLARSTLNGLSIDRVLVMPNSDEETGCEQPGREILDYLINDMNIRIKRIPFFSDVVNSVHDSYFLAPNLVHNFIGSTLTKPVFGLMAQLHLAQEYPGGVILMEDDFTILKPFKLFNLILYVAAQGDDGIRGDTTSKTVDYSTTSDTNKMLDSSSLSIEVIKQKQSKQTSHPLALLLIENPLHFSFNVMSHIPYDAISIAKEHLSRLEIRPVFSEDVFDAYFERETRMNPSALFIPGVRDLSLPFVMEPKHVDDWNDAITIYEKFNKVKTVIYKELERIEERRQQEERIEEANSQLKENLMYILAQAHHDAINAKNYLSHVFERYSQTQFESVLARGLMKQLPTVYERFVGARSTKLEEWRLLNRKQPNEYMTDDEIRIGLHQSRYSESFEPASDENTTRSALNDEEFRFQPKAPAVSAGFELLDEKSDLKSRRLQSSASSEIPMATDLETKLTLRGLCSAWGMGGRHSGNSRVVDSGNSGNSNEMVDKRIPGELNSNPWILSRGRILSRHNMIKTQIFQGDHIGFERWKNSEAYFENGDDKRSNQTLAAGQPPHLISVKRPVYDFHWDKTVNDTLEEVIRDIKDWTRFFRDGHRGNFNYAIDQGGSVFTRELQAKVVPVSEQVSGVDATSAMTEGAGIPAASVPSARGWLHKGTPKIDVREAAKQQVELVQVGEQFSSLSSTSNKDGLHDEKPFKKRNLAAALLKSKTPKCRQVIHCPVLNDHIKKTLGLKQKPRWRWRNKPLESRLDSSVMNHISEKERYESHLTDEYVNVANSELSTEVVLIRDEHFLELEENPPPWREDYSGVIGKWVRKRNLPSGFEDYIDLMQTGSQIGEYRKHLSSLRRKYALYHAKKWQYHVTNATLFLRERKWKMMERYNTKLSKQKMNEDSFIFLANALPETVPLKEMRFALERTLGRMKNSGKNEIYFPIFLSEARTLFNRITRKWFDMTYGDIDNEEYVVVADQVVQENGKMENTYLPDYGQFHYLRMALQDDPEWPLRKSSEKITIPDLEHIKLEDVFPIPETLDTMEEVWIRAEEAARNAAKMNTIQKATELAIQPDIESMSGSTPGGGIRGVQNPTSTPELVSQGVRHVYPGALLFRVGFTPHEVQIGSTWHPPGNNVYNSFHFTKIPVIYLLQHVLPHWESKKTKLVEYFDHVEWEEVFVEIVEEDRRNGMVIPNDGRIASVALQTTASYQPRPTLLLRSLDICQWGYFVQTLHFAENEAKFCHERDGLPIVIHKPDIALYDFLNTGFASNETRHCRL